MMGLEARWQTTCVLGGLTIVIVDLNNSGDDDFENDNFEDHLGNDDARYVDNLERPSSIMTGAKA